MNKESKTVPMLKYFPFTDTADKHLQPPSADSSITFTTASNLHIAYLISFRKFLSLQHRRHLVTKIFTNVLENEYGTAAGDFF